MMKFKLLVLLWLAVQADPVSAQKDRIFSTKEGAIKGYDPVAYFKAGKAVEGTKAFSLEWMGATWNFSSKENMEEFRKDPGAWAPRFGGYCAYAVSQGYTYRIDPEAWKIVDGMLYLNYSKKIREKWEANLKEFIELANDNWPGVIEK